jgi:ELWxxDGT repeat protein
LSVILALVLGAVAPQAQIPELGTPQTLSEPYLVRDIFPGATGSRPGALAAADGTLFFGSADIDHGRELWKSNGSEAGTILVKDIVTGTTSSLPEDLTYAGGTLFFDAYHETYGWELSKSDGTEAGTRVVKDINPGWDWSEVSDLTDVNGTLFFAAYEATHGRELWKSHGTEARTILVKDIITGTGSSVPRDLIDVDGVLFFTADDGTHGRELWKSDGTETGTTLVSDITPGSGDSDLGYLTSMNGVLFFTLSDYKVWKSDGTEAGTVMIAGPYEWASHLAAVNGTLFFGARDDDHGFELWKSDGTEGGTTRVKDIHPGAPHSYPTNLIDVNGTLYFNANDGVHSYELWMSDGTQAGTTLIRDINPLTTCSASGYDPGSGSHPCSSSPAGVGGGYAQAVVGGKLFLNANDGRHGAELWTSDGTEAGTVLIQDINPLTTCDQEGENPGSGSFPCASDPDDLTAVDGMLYFNADDGDHGEELWALEVEIPPDCVEVSGVTLAQLTAGPIYPHTTVEFSADIAPVTATAPYTYAVDGGAAMTTTETTIPLTRSFAGTGTHGVEIAAWNCAMAVPVTDSVAVEVRPRMVYLPLLRRQ